nr:hypothetical protein [Nonomuraea mesophila]
MQFRVPAVLLSPHATAYGAGHHERLGIGSADQFGRAMNRQWRRGQHGHLHEAELTETGLSPEVALQMRFTAGIEWHPPL